MKFCICCGCEMEDEDTFCINCGEKQEEIILPINENKDDSEEEKIQEPVKETVQKKLKESKDAVKHVQISMERNTEKKKREKKGKGAFVFYGIAGTVFLLAVFGLEIVMVSNNKSNSLPEISYSYLEDVSEIYIDYKMAEDIYPLMYNRLDSIMEFSACTSGGEKEIEISVEIPGFTQKYEKKFKINEQITQFYIHPALLLGDLNLDSGKEAQVNISVTDTKTGEIIVKDTPSVYLKSMHDIPTGLVSTGWGYNAYDNFLAAMTPEDKAIDVLIRKAADEMKIITTEMYGEENSSDSMKGYQSYGYEDEGYGTLYQVMALQLAMSDLGVKYIQSNYSSSKTDVFLQRMKLPSDVLESQSGLCVETSVYIASALQELDMNAFLIMPPGHCQVAVEAWPETGVYILLETTALPVDTTTIWNNVGILKEDKLENYITNYNGQGQGCYVLDCGMAQTLGFTKTNN